MHRYTASIPVNMLDELGPDQATAIVLDRVRRLIVRDGLREVAARLDMDELTYVITVTVEADDDSAASGVVRVPPAPTPTGEAHADE